MSNSFLYQQNGTLPQQQNGTTQVKQEISATMEKFITASQIITAKEQKPDISQININGNLNHQNSSTMFTQQGQQVVNQGMRPNGPQQQVQMNPNQRFIKTEPQDFKQQMGGGQPGLSQQVGQQQMKQEKPDAWTQDKSQNQNGGQVQNQAAKRKMSDNKLNVKKTAELVNQAAGQVKERKPSVNSTPSSKDVKFNVLSLEELKAKLLPIWEIMFNAEPDANPFKEPVDPIKLQIPDYHEVVKKPMDLRTIGEKLKGG